MSTGHDRVRAALLRSKVLRIKDHADALDADAFGDIDHSRSDSRFRKSLLVRDMLIVMKCDLFALSSSWSRGESINEKT